MPRWNTEEEMWALIVRHGLPRFRMFRRALTVAELDKELGNFPSWTELKAKIQPGDKIWPFMYPRNKRYWGKKHGYVVLRRGKFVGGIVRLSE